MNNEFLGLYSETNVGHKRSVNEDFLGYDETPNGYLYVVCDGMGGHVGGATASQLAVNSIISFFYSYFHQHENCLFICWID